MVQLLRTLLPALSSVGIRTVLLLVQVVTNLYVNETYILYQCGTNRPSADAVPAGSKFFEIPLTSVTVLETIPYAYLVSTDQKLWFFLVPTPSNEVPLLATLLVSMATAYSLPCCTVVKRGICACCCDQHLAFAMSYVLSLLAFLEV